MFKKNRQLLFCCSSNNCPKFLFFFFFFFKFHFLSGAHQIWWAPVFYLIVLFSFCTQIFLFTCCEVENDNCRQWLQNSCFFARKQLLELDLTEATKTNPYVQFSVFSNDLLSLICLKEDPRMDQLLKMAKRIKGTEKAYPMVIRLELFLESG